MKRVDNLIATVDKKDREQIRVSTKESKGQRWIDVRVYASGRPQEEKWPTGQGFLISAQEWGHFREGILRAEKALKEAGWFHE
jgi:hypothetical protein